MAGNKKPRKTNNKASADTRAVHNANLGVRMTLNKFQIMGDMNHRPTAFHLRGAQIGSSI